MERSALLLARVGKRCLMTRSLFFTLIMSTCVAASPSVAQQGGTFGKNVTVPALRPPIEPGRVFAGNDQGVLQQMRALVARPEADSAAIVAELEAVGLDNLAPLILTEYARRQKLLGNADWRYWVELGVFRANFDKRACVDPTAPQFITVYMMEYEGQLDKAKDTSKFMVAANEQNDGRWQILRRILTSGEAFTSKASAWWVCSHGMAAMSAGMGRRQMSLDGWWKGAEARDRARKEGEAALDGLLKQKGF